MRVPISWLKDYVDISLSVSELAEKLTFAGLEVERIEYIGLPGGELPWDRDKIFVAQVRNVERHPNADKLLLVDLNYGEGRDIRVVTGAPNLAPGNVGQKVVLACKGSRLYDGHKEGKVITVLKEATLRGIKNDSMVCSEKELGMSEEHDGIILLPEDAPVGTPLVDYWGDAILDVSILPNTARCAGMVGIAREIAAITGAPLRHPRMDYAENDSASTSDLVRIEIHQPNLNPRFTAGIIKNIKQAASPMWMQRRLKMCGIRAIGNVVDVSNYVMLELGYPTHTFDYDAIRGECAKRIYTRTAEAHEKITTLDGKERVLLPTDILVCDEQGATSLAGVMGGVVSEVSANTTNVLFEVAAWHNIAIRKTAHHHDLHSEASFRFSRGLHPDQAVLAQKRGLYLLQQLTGGTVTRGLVDVYPNPVTPVVVTLDPNYVRRITGMDIPNDEMVRILQTLEFEVSDAHDHTLTVTTPNHRVDIEGQHDLAEEVGRIYGYDKLPARLMSDALPIAAGNPQLEFEERLKDILVNAGLSETVSYRMTTPEAEAKLFAPGTPKDERPYVMLKNPINPERAAMRHTLMGNVLEALALNVRHHKTVSLFEVGNIYLGSEANDGAGLPDELPRLCIALTGAQDALGWSKKGASQMDFFALKGVLESVLSSLKIDATFAGSQHPSFFPGRTAVLETAGKHAVRLGVMGELHPLVREQLGLPDTPVLVAELDVAALRTAAQTKYLISDVPRFPAVQEDLAVIVNDDVNAADVAQAIFKAGDKLLASVTLFDVYRGEQLGVGKKSLAYALSYQADDRTLGEKDVEKLRGKIIRTLEATMGATIRQ